MRVENPNIPEKINKNPEMLVLASIQIKWLENICKNATPEQLGIQCSKINNLFIDESATKSNIDFSLSLNKLQNPIWTIV